MPITVPLALTQSVATCLEFEFEKEQVTQQNHPHLTQIIALQVLAAARKYLQDNKAISCAVRGTQSELSDWFCG